MSNKARVGITIPFYKNEIQLAKCKAAIKAQTFQDIEVFVFNNTEKNHGFTRACNMGLRNFLTSKDYNIILNQDCYLEPDAIEKMVTFMNSEPDCAIAGIKQVSTLDNDKIMHGGCTTAYPNGMHYVGSVKAGHHNKNRKMPWVNGACMIVNNSLIPEFGYMDENYFLICSDSDWCYTARQRGFSVWYIADAVCKHEEGGISRKNDNTFLTDKMRDDTLYFSDKWIGNGCFRELSMEIFE